MSSVCFDFAAKCPNTKIKGKLLRESIAFLMEQDEVKNTTSKSTTAFIDAVDVSIRTAMMMYRHLKADLAKREQVLRRLSSKDSKRVRLVLEQLLLPANYDLSQEVMDPSDDDREASFSAPARSPSSTAMVPYHDSQGSSERNVPDVPAKEEDLFDTSVFEDIQQQGSLLDAQKVGFSPDKKRRISKGSAGFNVTGVDFLHEQDESDLDKLPAVPAASVHASDRDLLLEAESHVPAKAKITGKKPAVLKRPSVKASSTTSGMKRPASVHAESVVRAEHEVPAAEAT